MAVDQQPPPWGGQPPGHPIAPTSGLALASLVCSVVGLATLGLAAVAGVICGHLALRETRSGQYGGHSMAIAGLIIGWVQCGLWIVFWVIMLTPATP